MFGAGIYILPEFVPAWNCFVSPYNLKTVDPASIDKARQAFPDFTEVFSRETDIKIVARTRSVFLEYFRELFLLQRQIDRHGEMNSTHFDRIILSVSDQNQIEQVIEQLPHMHDLIYLITYFGRLRYDQDIFRYKEWDQWEEKKVEKDVVANYRRDVEKLIEMFGSVDRQEPPYKISFLFRDREPYTIENQFLIDEFLSRFKIHFTSNYEMPLDKSLRYTARFYEDAIRFQFFNKLTVKICRLMIAENSNLNSTSNDFMFLISKIVSLVIPDRWTVDEDRDARLRSVRRCLRSNQFKVG